MLNNKKKIKHTQKKTPQAMVAEGQIFPSHPLTNNGLFFLLTIKYQILMIKMSPEVPEYAEMRHNMIMSLKCDNDVTGLSMISCLIFYPSHRLVRPGYVR